MSTSRGFWFTVMIVLGFGIGLYFAWMVYPVHVVDSTYHDLRQDYKTDYVLMVAEVYQSESKRFDAIIRLDRLEEESTEAAILRAIENAEKLGYPDSDIDMLYELKAAISGQVEDSLRPDDIYIDFNPLQATPTPTAQSAPILEIGEVPGFVPTSALSLPTPIVPTAVPDDPFADQGAGTAGQDALHTNPFMNQATGDPFLTQNDPWLSTSAPWGGN